MILLKKWSWSIVITNSCWEQKTCRPETSPMNTLQGTWQIKVEIAEKPLDSNPETGTRIECLTQLRKKWLKAVNRPEKMYLGAERTGGAQITGRKVGILGRVKSLKIREQKMLTGFLKALCRRTQSDKNQG